MACLLFFPLFSFWGPHYVTSLRHRPWMFYAVLQPVLLAFGLSGILSRSSSEVLPQPCPVYSASKAAFFSAQGLHLAFPSGSPLEFPPLCSLSDLHAACFIHQRPQHTGPGHFCFFTTAGSSLLHGLYTLLRWGGLPSRCGAQASPGGASPRGGFCCSEHGLQVVWTQQSQPPVSRAEAQQLWHLGYTVSVAPRHVGSSQIRN